MVNFGNTGKPSLDCAYLLQPKETTLIGDDSLRFVIAAGRYEELLTRTFNFYFDRNSFLFLHR